MDSREPQLLSQIKIYKSKIVLEEYQLQNFVKYLDQVVFKKIFFFCSPYKVSLAPSFQRAFKALTQIQKADYYLSSLKIIHQFNRIHEFVEEKKYQSEKFQVQFRNEVDNKLWKKTNVILHYDTITLQLQALKTSCNLCNYIIRKSKSKNKNAFVLESTRAQSQPTTLRISHPNESQLKALTSKMKVLMQMALRKKIARMMRISSQPKMLTNERQQKQQCMSVKLVSNLPLQHKSIRNILRAKSIEVIHSSPDKNFNIPQVLVNQDTVRLIDDFNDYQEVQSGFFVHKNKKRVKKLYYYNSVTISFADIDSILFNHQTFEQWKNSLCSISLIGDVPKQGTKFFHQINIYKDCSEADFVFMRHRFQKQNFVYYVDKSVQTAEYGSHENTNSRGKIQYTLWRLRQKSKEVIELIVETQITQLPCTDVYKGMSQQIGELQKIPLVRKVAQKPKKISANITFFSVQESDLSVSLDLLNELQSYQGVEFLKQLNPPIVSSTGNLNKTQSFYSIQNSEHSFVKKESRISSAISLSSKILRQTQYRYQLIPKETQNSQLREFKQGCFFDPSECLANEKGDLVFKNQQKIQAQGAVIKTVLKRIGTNIFSGKSILNLSLPIQIFATDTNLQRLCRSMAYAPHFLENKGSLPPLEKMKAAICFALGNLLLYIEMAKPFNPILGQTYQGFIDGCPVYGEQISHHPPISSLYLVGRGYKVLANIEAKVDMGLNSASGLNDGCYHITFDNDSSPKSGIVFTSPPGQLSGVIYGERKLNIIEKSRYLDVQNRLYCELSWGKSRGAANTVGRYHDYVQGKIVQLNRPISHINKIKQNEKDIVLGHITGRWTEFLYFNGEPIFQVNKVHPYQVVQESHQLPSDSHFREDRLILEQYKPKEAQAAKQRLQQLQRLDRKLRKQYGF